ncbi:MAG TPA: YdcF family protein [Terriglobales bacterium]|nr:YdcF family protein [Terriglobales bacterium]
MNDYVVKRHWYSHRLVRLLLLIAALVLLFIAVVCMRIVHQAGLQEIHPADAIIVFGAAEYYGRPSPVYRARLDHAFDLFQKHVATLIITTGGAGEDPRFSEGGVGHDYLMRRGIPEQNLIAETQGADTAQSAQRVAVIMRTNGMHSCLAVSDEYHVFRIQKLLEHEGIRVYVAPRRDSRPHSGWQRMLAVLREAFSYLAWRLHVPV